MLGELSNVTMHLFQTRVRITKLVQGSEGPMKLPEPVHESLIGLELHVGPAEPSGIVFHCDTFTGLQQLTDFTVHRVNWRELVWALEKRNMEEVLPYFRKAQVFRRPTRIDGGISWFRTDEVEVCDNQPELWISRGPRAVIHRQLWTEESGEFCPLVWSSCRLCELGYPAILAHDASSYLAYRYAPAGYAVYPGSICLTREAVNDLLEKGEEKVCKRCLNA